MSYRRRGTATRRIHRPIILDQDFIPVDSTGSGTGPLWWLDERDAARAAANDPSVQAVQREIDRQARLARGHEPVRPRLQYGASCSIAEPGSAAPGTPGSYFFMWRLVPSRIKGHRKTAKIADRTPRQPWIFWK